MEMNAPFSVLWWISMVGMFIVVVSLLAVVFDEIVYQAVKDKNVDNVYVQLSVSSNTYTESRNVTVRSISKLYTGSLANNGVFTVMTAIIHVENGVVQSISWDDNCNTCLSNCADNSVMVTYGTLELITEETEVYNVYHGENCYEPRSDCDQEGANCDLQIFVVWSGTDVRGRVFESSNVRMTRFQSGSVESIIHTL